MKNLPILSRIIFLYGEVIRCVGEYKRNSCKTFFILSLLRPSIFPGDFSKKYHHLFHGVNKIVANLEVVNNFFVFLTPILIPFDNCKFLTLSINFQSFMFGFVPEAAEHFLSFWLRPPIFACPDFLCRHVFLVPNPPQLIGVDWSLGVNIYHFTKVSTLVRLCVPFSIRSATTLNTKYPFYDFYQILKKNPFYGFDQILKHVFYRLNQIFNRESQGPKTPNFTLFFLCCIFWFSPPIILRPRTAQVQRSPGLPILLHAALPALSGGGIFDPEPEIFLILFGPTPPPPHCFDHPLLKV